MMVDHYVIKAFVSDQHRLRDINEYAPNFTSLIFKAALCLGEIMKRTKLRSQWYFIVEVTYGTGATGDLTFSYEEKYLSYDDYNDIKLLTKTELTFKFI